MMKCLLIFNLPYKYRAHTANQSRLIAVFQYESIEEKENIISNIAYLKKIYPYMVMYETINDCQPFARFCPQGIVYTSQNKLSLDIDFNNYKYIDSFMLKLKYSLIEAKVKSDLQISPHGFHLIIGNMYRKEACTIIHKCIKNFSKRPVCVLDLKTFLKLVDGQFIDGVKVNTIENWT